MGSPAEARQLKELVRMAPNITPKPNHEVAFIVQSPGYVCGLQPYDAPGPHNPVGFNID